MEQNEENAKKKHQELAGLVKGVHAQLRSNLRKSDGNYEKVWREHCQNTAVLSQYAQAMYHLATDFWTKHPETRIDWCYKTCLAYFHHGGLQRYLEKQKRRETYAELAQLQTGTKDTDNVHMETGKEEAATYSDSSSQDTSLLTDKQRGHCNIITSPFQGQLCLLDVGSCFNPFKGFKDISSVAIDISPAVEDVHCCDFLNLSVTEAEEPDSTEECFRHLPDPVDTLPAQSFHVVVFSLLLEYFPCALQRWICCQKAQQLLMVNGLLLLITPDSHNQNRNAPMMKSWKLAIESLGFSRWRYVKLEHLHCMAFVKTLGGEEHPSCLVTKTTPDMLYIPQDFHADDQTGEVDPIVGQEYDGDNLQDAFTELPLADVLDTSL